MRDIAGKVTPYEQKGNVPISASCKNWIACDMSAIDQWRIAGILLIVTAISKQDFKLLTVYHQNLPRNSFYS